MRGMSILALAALLTVADARPGGYGVKGGRSYQSTANAVASAHADTGSPATASSSAIATADSRGYGASKAVASADASADARNVQFDVRHGESGNANGLVDFDDLRRSKDRGSHTEYKCVNHGTASGNQHDAEHVTSEFDREDTQRTEQIQGYDDCGSDAVNAGASKDAAESRCKTSGVDGGSNGQATQTIESSHSSGPCASGDSKCSASNLGTSLPDLPTGSSSAGGIEGYGGINERPGMIDRSHAASPCPSENPKCHLSEPGVPNTYPPFPKHPDSSAGSADSAGGADHATSHGKPETIGEDHPGSKCAPGDSECTNSHRQFGKPDLPAGSQNPADANQEGPSLEPGEPHGAGNSSPACAGAATCFSHKTTDSQHSSGPDGGHEESKEKLGTPVGSSCAPGDSKCFARKPSVSNPYPTHFENPDLSAGSSGPKAIDGGHGGEEKPGQTDQSDYGTAPCAPWDSECSSIKPTVSNLPTSWNNNPSYDSQHSERGRTSTAGTFGASHSKCAAGDSKCAHESVPTIHPHANPNTWTPSGAGHSHADKVERHHPSGSKPGTSNPFLNGQIDFSSIKNPSSSDEPPREVNPSNPFLYPNNQAHHPSQSPPIGATPQRPQGSSVGASGFPQHSPKPPNPFLTKPGHANPPSGAQHPGGVHQHEEKEYTVANGSPNVDCHGSAACAPIKPSNHFPVPPKHPHGSSSQIPTYQETKPSPSNPFLPHHIGGKPAGSAGLEVANQENPHTASQSASNTSGKDCDKSSSANKPAVVPSENPFLTHRPKVEGHSTQGRPTQFPGTRPDNGPATDPVAGHENAPADEGQSGTVQGCGISSVVCNKVPSQTEHQSSTSGGLQSSSAAGRNDHGVKGHRPGVKGEPRRHPVRLQGSSELDEDDHVRPEQNPSAASIADASAHSHAHASSSSSVSGAHSHASAKSEAHSSHDGHGSSSSWASSNASAFASSYSSSGAYHVGWTEPELPEVPAQ